MIHDWHWIFVTQRSHSGPNHSYQSVIAQLEIRWQKNRSRTEALHNMSSSTTLLQTSDVESSRASSEAGSIRDCYLYNPDNSEQKQVQILIASAQSKVFCHLQTVYFDWSVFLAEGETLLPKVQATLRDSWWPLLGSGLCASQVRLILRVMQSHATSSCMLHKRRGLHQVLFRVKIRVEM